MVVWRGAFHFLGQTRRFAWQCPSSDCYALLGLSPSASNDQIKAAYFRKAKQVHPDVGDGGSAGNDAIVRLNLCYEALTRRRSEYDTAKGTGMGSGRASAYGYSGTPGGSSGSRTSWWKDSQKSSAEGAADFSGFWDDWEEEFHRKSRKSTWQPPRGTTSWREWSEEWRFEDEDGYRPSRGQKRDKRGSRRPMQEVDDDSTEDEVDEEMERDSDWGKRRRQRDKGKQRQKGPPSDIQIVLSRQGRGNKGSASAIAGAYSRVKPDLNNRPVYEKSAGRSHFLFWSAEYGDWKVAERLEDDGVCIAFAEDSHGRRRPWEKALRWCAWDPVGRRFAALRLEIEPCVLDDDEEDADEIKDAEVDECENEVLEEVLSKWSTNELISWCNTRDLSLGDCFDRESILERMLEFVSIDGAEASSIHGSSSSKPSTSSADTSRGRRGRRSSVEDEDTASSSREGSSQRRRSTADGGEPRRAKAVTGLRIASRVKTDGSYTRKPSLDKKIKLYGNRVEPFRGDEEEMLHWLQHNGDQSRLYGIFWDGAFCYSLVWKKRLKQWGKAIYRRGSRTPDW